MRRPGVRAGILEGKRFSGSGLVVCPRPWTASSCQLLGLPCAPLVDSLRGDPRAGGLKPQPLKQSVFLPEKMSVLFQSAGTCAGAPSLREALDPAGPAALPCRWRPVLEARSPQALQSAVTWTDAQLPSRCCSPLVFWAPHAFLTSLSPVSGVCWPGARAVGVSLGGGLTLQAQVQASAWEDGTFERGQASGWGGRRRLALERAQERGLARAALGCRCD